MLVWPQESVFTGDELPEWQHAGSNLCLDFHGDLLAAELVVFSDGNHHMALHETVRVFSEQYPDAGPIFYATTPPGPLVKLLKNGRLQIGNLVVSAKPHVFISPPSVLDGLVDDGYLHEHVPFVRNQGSVFIVKKGNPKNIHTVADLARPDVRLFLSNPRTEAVSYQGYIQTLLGLAAKEKVDLSFLTDKSSGERVVFGERIHHREAPQAIVDGIADVAIVYYHLALRYTNIFPSLFELTHIDGAVGNPRPAVENVISFIHAGIVCDGGAWGATFLSYLQSESVRNIYARHGLLPISG